MKKSNLPVAIIGLGKTGISIAKYLNKNNIKYIAYDTRENLNITDEIKKNINSKNIVLGKLLYILQEKGYKLHKQVLNYNGKVIGVIVSKNGIEGYLPCYPSSLIIDIGDGIVNLEWRTKLKLKDTQFENFLRKN